MWISRASLSRSLPHLCIMDQVPSISSSNFTRALKYLKIAHLRFYRYLCSILKDLVNIFKGIFSYLCKDPVLDAKGKDQRKSLLSLV